jgi:hypothetical protein
MILSFELNLNFKAVSKKPVLCIAVPVIEPQPNISRYTGIPVYRYTPTFNLSSIGIRDLINSSQLQTSIANVNYKRNWLASKEKICQIDRTSHFHLDDGLKIFITMKENMYINFAWDDQFKNIHAINIHVVLLKRTKSLFSDSVLRSHTWMCCIALVTWPAFSGAWNYLLNRMTEHIAILCHFYNMYPSIPNTWDIP